METTLRRFTSKRFPGSCKTCIRGLGPSEHTRQTNRSSSSSQPILYTTEIKSSRTSSLASNHNHPLRTTTNAGRVKRHRGQHIQHDHRQSTQQHQKQSETAMPLAAEINSLQARRSSTHEQHNTCVTLCTTATPRAGPSVVHTMRRWVARPQPTPPAQHITV